MSDDWTKPLEDLSRHVSPARRADILDRLADLPADIRQRLMGFLPDTASSRKIIFDVASVRKSTFNQDALVDFTEITAREGNRRPRRSGGVTPRPWKRPKPKPMRLDRLYQHVNRIAAFLRYIQETPYIQIPDRGDVDLATVNDDLAQDYLAHRRNGTAPAAGNQILHGGNRSVGWKGRNNIRMSIHHFYYTLHGAEVAERAMPWNLERGQESGGPSTWPTGGQIQENIEDYGVDEYVLIIHLARGGIKPEIAVTRRRDDIRFPRGRLAVRIDKGWVTLPIDPAPFEDRIAQMLASGDDGYLVRGPGPQGHATGAQHTHWMNSRGKTPMSLRRISHWGQANLLALGYDPLYVARVASSREVAMKTRKRDAQAMAAPGVFDTVEELAGKGSHGYTRCSQCELTQELTGSRFQKCANCGSRLGRTQLEPELVRLLHAQNRNNRYAQAVGRSIEQEARRLLRGLGVIDGDDAA